MKFHYAITARWCLSPAQKKARSIEAGSVLIAISPLNVRLNGCVLDQMAAGIPKVSNSDLLLILIGLMVGNSLGALLAIIVANRRYR